MIHSMTAFARGEAQGDDKTISVEIRSVNHRFCEIAVRMPRPWIALEEKIKNRIRQALSRGRVDVTVEVRSQGGSSQVYEADAALARNYYEAVKEVHEALGLSDPIPIDSIIRLNGVINASSVKPDLESDWSLLEQALSQALDALSSMRETEGEALHEDFLGRLKKLEESLESVSSMAASQPEVHLEKLKERLAALLEGAADLDPARLAQEAAFLADKSDITEEIVRARSHIAQFRDILDQEEPPGRSLNFLAQELHREFSTMGSKSSDAGLSHVVVAAKAEVEKIREQVQNVE
ncbi:TIGR00255 family protein [Desulfatibacillum alkenivorans DSM 16219]|uniref:TIGR00255 family protein n=1 Tax=Desulfatibacillum alkenivorans DSM 16219 TaxID=1121393 RepID=A0A1M6IL64_9BACT|nr:YicC/YloC family endoribonuclease [Desulfatibacillum alkenivorans]SHJ35133.1 TIGR00255 family protein [Desulfatibacillum alkenivorans DSM 16219]